VKAPKYQFQLSASFSSSLARDTPSSLYQHPQPNPSPSWSKTQYFTAIKIPLSIATSATMSGTDAYGSTFHALATKFRQHEKESHARASAQADLKSRCKCSLVANGGRSAHYTASTARPTSMHIENLLTDTSDRATRRCPSCHLIRRTSTTSTASSTASSTRSSYHPDMAISSERDVSYHNRRHEMRHSILTDHDRDQSEDSSTSSHASPAETHSRASVDPTEREHLARCHCGSIRPMEDLDKRAARRHQAVR
jgi:hypothetical protein